MHRGSLSIDRGINAIYRFIRFFLLYCNFLPTGSREEPYELTDFFDVVNAYSDREKVNTFLCSFIEKHHSDSVYMRSLFDSIAKMTDEQRIAYIKLYLEYDVSIENFKDLPLLSSFSSWSGSEVPLIHNKIEFLNKLSQEIHGIDYLEHKQYIGKMITDLNSYAKDVEIREILRGY